MPRTTAERFIDRVRDVLDEKHIPQKELLREGQSQGWISNKLRGRRRMTLNEAAEIAEALNMPLTELLRKPEDRVYELDNLEVRVMDAFRQLSDEEQTATVTLLTLRQRQAPYATGRQLAMKARRTSSTRGPRGRIASAGTAAGTDAVDDAISTFVDALSTQAPHPGRETPAARPPRPVVPERHRTRR